MLGHPASFLTVLLQGGVGGLQVLVGACLGGALGGRRTPVPGALVVNSIHRARAFFPYPSCSCSCFLSTKKKKNRTSRVIS
jgi:hypothetical protein